MDFFNRPKIGFQTESPIHEKEPDQNPQKARSILELIPPKFWERFKSQNEGLDPASLVYQFMQEFPKIPCRYVAGYFKSEFYEPFSYTWLRVGDMHFDLYSEAEGLPLDIGSYLPRKSYSAAGLIRMMEKAPALLPHKKRFFQESFGSISETLLAAAP